MLRKTLAALTFCIAGAAHAEDALDIAYLRVEQPAAPTLSNLDPVPGDIGLAGARLGLADNQTTGRFLGQSYTLTEFELPEGSAAPDIAALIAPYDFVVLDTDAATLTAIADMPDAAGKLLFNSASREAALRDTNCRANLLHTIPSDAMRADALVQFLVKKRWTKPALIAGPQAADQTFAEAITASLLKFGLKSPKRADWVFDADMRRNAAQEVPLFTQQLGEHDVLLIADETNDFARYVAYNTWLPRPVAGATGLRAVAWDRVVEQWGAAQLQSRFRKLAGRDMRPQDYAAWAALRSLGEALTRTKSTDPVTLRAYLLSDDFELAGFKGRPLSYRNWNGQLRQPIALVAEGAVAASAPFEAFLHQHNELDTLGVDRPQSACRAFDGE